MQNDLPIKSSMVTKSILELTKKLSLLWLGAENIFSRGDKSVRSGGLKNFITVGKAVDAPPLLGSPV